MFRALASYWLILLFLPCCFVLSALRAEEPKVDLSKLPPASSGKMDYVRDIQPIFAATCVKCHGTEKQKGGLRLDSGSEALKGGNAGAVVKAGDSQHSKLVHLVAALDPDAKMPPNGKLLSAEEIGRIRAWIDQGALVPKDAVAVTAVPAKSPHWSFQPIARPGTPKVSTTGWIRNDIDAFILARLEKEKI